MRAPPLKFLKTFQLAATHLSFKVASERLFITPSAVSHQIKSLEEQLGVTLFERSPHSLSLTEAGAAYLEHLNNIFRRLETATEQLCTRQGRTLVRLHVPSFFASEMLLPRLPSFLDCRPDADIHINTVHSPLQHHSAEADLSVIVGAVPDDELDSHRLFSQAFVPSCSPLLLQQHPIHTVSDLNAHTLIVHQARRDGWDRWTEFIGEKPLRPRKLILFDSLNAVAQAAERGIGVALLSSPLGYERFMHGSLVKPFDFELVTAESYFLIHRKEDREQAEVMALKLWMLQEFSNVRRRT